MMRLSAKPLWTSQLALLVLGISLLQAAVIPEAFAQATATGNQSLVYQGRIVRPDGSVPNAETITFTMAVYSPAPSNCLLYAESQSLNMAGSQGMFSLKLGEGTRTDGGSHPYLDIFVNGKTLTGLNCAVGNSYTAASNDDRKLRVIFNDNGTIVNLTAMSIKSVPFALQARQIEGWGLDNLVKVSSIGSPTTFTTAELAKVKGISALGCAANEVLKWNGSAWGCATDSTGTAPGDAGYGAASKGVVAFDTDAATSGISVASGLAKLSLTGVSAGTYGAAGSVSQVVIDAQGRVSSALEVPIQIASNQISVSGGTLGQVLKWNGSAWLPDADLGITSESDPSVQGFAKNAPSARFVTTGSVLDLAVSGVSAGTYGSATQVPVVTVDAFGRVTGVTNTTITGASPVGAALNAAQFWVGDASNLAAAVSLSGDASLFNNGSLTINKLQGQTLTLAANPGAGALLTYNTSLARWEALALPDCTASETLGFNSISGNYECQTINNATNFTGSLIGDVTGPQGATTVSRLQGQALQISSLAARDTLVYNGSAWVNANIPSCGANQYLTFNGTYFCVTDTGSAGVVTSVDVAVPSFLSTSGGPITSSGTISLGLQNQNANLVFAGPASGGAAAPSFRSLAADDIPVLDAAKISSGTLAVSRGGTGSGAALANNKVMVSSGGAIVEGDGFGSVKANNTYVLRDAAGGFAAGAVTVDSSILKGATSGSLTLQAPGAVTSYSLTFPNALGLAGQMLLTDASGNLSWGTPNVGTVTSVSSSNAYLSVANGTSSATLTLNVGTAANTVAAGDDARIVGAVQRSGDTMSGALNMGGQDLDSAGNIRMNASKYLGMGQFAADPDTSAWGASEKGRTWFNAASNELKYWDGAGIKVLGVAGGGLETLNGLNAANQSFAVGTAGTDFAITSSGSTHTFNLPTASSSNRGLLSSADFTTFTNKLSSSSQFAGDVSGTVSALTVNRIQGVPVTGSLSANNFLKYNGSAWMGSNLTNSDVTTGLGYAPLQSLNGLTALSQSFVTGTSGTAPAYVSSGSVHTLNLPMASGAGVTAGLLAKTDYDSFAAKLGTSTSFSGDVAGPYNAVTVNKLQGQSLALGGASGGQVLRYNGSAWVNTGLSFADVTTALNYAPVNRAGDTMSGALNLGGNDLNNAGDLNMAANKLLGLSQYAGDPATGAWGASEKGRTWFNASSNEIKYWDGAAVRTLGVAGSGVQSLNGLNANNQSFALGTTGTDVNIVSSGSTHTFNLPTASGSNRGLLAVSDWLAFNSKLSTTTQFAGDVSGTYDNLTVNKIRGIAVSGTFSSSNFIKYNGSAFVGSNLSNADVTTGLGYAPLQSINGLTALSQSFVTGASGTAPAYVSAGSVHTLNLPMASGAGVTAGLLAKTDYDAFANKLGTTTSFAGDVAGPYNAVTVNKIQGQSLALGAASGGQVLRYNGSAWVNAGLSFADITTALNYAPVNRAGDTMSGALNLGGNDLNNAGNLNMAANKLLGLSQYAGDPATGAWGASEKGRTWFNASSNEIKYWDGSSVRTLGVAGSGVQSLNGLNANNQSFALGTTGTDANIVSSGSVHTFNLPTASASNRGLLSVTDWLSFNSKLSSSSQFAGDVSGTVSALTVNRIQGVPVTGSLSANNFLKYNGSAWMGSNLSNADVTTGLGYAPLQSLNGLTALSQSFVTGTSGTAPAYVSSGSVHTLNLPMASGAGVTAGLLAKNDYDSFVAKLGTTTSFAGDVAGPYSAVTVNKLQGQSLALVAGSAGQVLRYNGSAWVNTGLSFTDITTALNYAPVNRAGDTMSGALNLGGNDLNNAGSITMAANKLLGLSQYAGDPATGSWGAAEKGRTWFNASSNEIKYWDGSAIRTLGVSGSGLQSLNGLNANNQSFALGTTGTDANIVSSGSVHTFNLPTSSASNRGLLSSSDFTTFSNKLGTSTSFAGDVSGSYNALTVNRLRGTNVSVGSLASGEFLRYNGSAWVNQVLSASDVTSGLGYTPVNRAGDTMSGALNLNNNDLTAVASLQLKGSTTGTLTLAAPLSVTSYTLRFPSAVGSAGQVLATDASGNLSWASSGGGLPANSLPIYQVRVATTANITLSGTQTIDGVAVVAGDRVLVKNQTTAADNGVYVVAAGAWTRATDMDAWSEVVGYRVQVSEGTAWAGMTYSSAVTVGGTLGTTAIDWNASGSGNPSQGNTANGYGALWSKTNAYYNTAHGSQALSFNTSGDSNTATGYRALYSNTTGTQNTAHGSQALTANTIGNYNTATGSGALYSNTTGTYNTATGSWVLTSNTTGTYNTATGNQALDNNTTGSNNTATGRNALFSNKAKSESTAIGYNSMANADNTTSASTSFNTALGAYSLRGSATAANNTGVRNTALGHSALYNMTSGSGNVGIGTSAGSAITTGSNNIVIGSDAGADIATSSNNILFSDGAGNRRMTIKATGSVGIGTTNPGSLGLMLYNGHILHLASSSNNSSFIIADSKSGSGAPSFVWSAGTGTTSGKRVFDAIYLGDILKFDVRNEGTSAIVTDNILVLSNSGNVGIGTSAPASILDINGAQTMRGMAAPAVSAAGQGRIYFDSTANKYKVSQNGGAYTDLVPAPGGGALSSLTAATATNTIDSLNFAQIWNWSTAATQTPLTVNANALTTGGILNLASSSASLNSTNGLLYVGNTGASTSGMVLRAQSNSTAGSGLSVLANGNVGIGTESASANLHAFVNAAGLPPTSGSSSVGVIARLDSLGNVLDFGGNGASGLWMQARTSADYSVDRPLLINPNGGDVGIGTTAPNAKLAVSGAATSRTNIIATGATVDLSLSNNHLLKDVGGSVITLQNLADGGTYTLYVSDVTSRTYTFTGCTNTYFSPGNGATTYRSAYTISVLVDGANTECYISWQTGFN